MAESSFRASFVLDLKDDLSAGLRRIIASTKQLRDLARSLGFKPLEGADAIVGRVDRGVKQLNGDLGTTARQAEAAAGAIKRMSAAELGRAREQSAQMRQAGAVARQAAGAGLGQVYGPGGVPLFSGGPRFVPNAPGASSRRGLLGRAGNALAEARTRFGAASEQVGLAGAALGGIALDSTIRKAAEFDNVLTHIAITMGTSADKMRGKVAELGVSYNKLALDTQQSSHDVAEAARFLITTGIGEQSTSKLLPIIAKAATAYATPIGDTVQGAFSFHEQMGIKEEDLRGALSAAALAAKQGHFSFADISALVPSVAAQGSTAGVTGRDGLNALLAALETSRRGAGSSGQAATNLQDFFSYINSQIGGRSFAKSGVNLPALLKAGEKQGINPIEAVVEKVRQLTAGSTPAETAQIVGKLFHNQEARIFVQTMLKELQYYQETKAKLAKADDATIDEDFKKAQNLQTQLNTLQETSAQLGKRAGLGFAWVVPVGAALLGGVLGGFQWLDLHLPGVADAGLALTGGMLGLVTATGALGVAAGPVRAGFVLLKPLFRGVLSSLSGAGAAFGGIAVLGIAAAVDIWRNWDRFRENFRHLWLDIRQVLSGDGIWNGAKKAMDEVWGRGGIMEKLMTDFVGWLPSWGQGFATALGSAMQTAYAATADFFKKMKADMESLVLSAPAGQAEQRKKLGMDPDGRDDSGLPGVDEMMHAPLPVKRSSYRIGAGGAHVIHVSFSADVPGRATVRHDDSHSLDGGRHARGPMLSRA